MRHDGHYLGCSLMVNSLVFADFRACLLFYLRRTHDAALAHPVVAGDEIDNDGRDVTV